MAKIVMTSARDIALDKLLASDVNVRRIFQLPTIPILVRAAPFKQNLNR